MIIRRLRIQALCERVGIETAYQLWQKMQEYGESVSKATAYEYWSGTKTMYRQETLDVFCEILKVKDIGELWEIKK